MAEPNRNKIYKRNPKSTKKVIMDKSFSHEKLIDFADLGKGSTEIEKIFDFQGWVYMLKNSDNMFHKKCLQSFYIHLKRPSYDSLESIVNGHKFVLSTDVISKALQVPNGGKSVFFDKCHTSTLLKRYPEDLISSLLLEEGVRYVNKLSTTHLKALPDIILTIIKSNIFQQAGHQAEVNNTQVALLCDLMDRQHVNFPQLMIDQIWKSTNQGNHSLVFPFLLTKIFKIKGLTPLEDELRDYSSLDYIDAETMKKKRRFTLEEEGFTISTKNKGASSTSTSVTSPIIPAISSSAPSVPVGITREDLVLITKELLIPITKELLVPITTKLEGISSFMSRVSKMPGFPSIADDEKAVDDDHIPDLPDLPSPSDD